MENIEILFKKSLKLHPEERLQLIEMIAKSLDHPNEVIDQIWAKEAENRYQSLENDRVKIIPFAEIF